MSSPLLHLHHMPAAMQRHHRTIADLKINEAARTIAFTDSALACKLTAMGMLPGAQVEMVRPAPFGNAYYIKVDGVRLALRAEEAQSILLEV
jgi:ferrous iron transport protein A